MTPTTVCVDCHRPIRGDGHHTWHPTTPNTPLPCPANEHGDPCRIDLWALADTFDYHTAAMWWPMHRITPGSPHHQLIHAVIAQAHRLTVPTVDDLAALCARVPSRRA